MELPVGANLHGFDIASREALPEIDGVAFIGKHAESGARLLYLQNDDNNKSFAIGFCTPPKDDTGVFHILEHSVLCGSTRFPVKEPFVDLLKGSMQTFLNAMTFADKTLYPVASTNEQDLLNLMDVYLDAVFHPNIYSKRAIFEQEGWHYELHARDGFEGNPAELSADQTALTYNGVVFNEMKGALSDANSVLYDEVQKALLPNTCYAFESGGTPEAIPALTYEGYLDEHRRHYRTDNSYIILYGNLDIDRVLAFIDERYLVPVAAEQRELDAQRQAEGLGLLRPRPITKAEGSAVGDVTFELPQLGDRCGGSRDEVNTISAPADAKILEMCKPIGTGMPHFRKTMDTAPENACAACGYVLGDSHDRVRTMAVEVLLDALFGSNEAPLKRALLDAGIAHDVSAYVSDALLQPFAIVQVNMPAGDAGARLDEHIAKAVADMLANGLDKKLVEAALSHAEFQMREHDMGYADGVIYSIAALSSWLYDDDAPLDYLRYEAAISELRAKLEGDYFEQLCRKLFLENAHAAAVEIVPTPGQSDSDAAERLTKMNVELTAEQRAQIVAGEALLRQLQEAPDTPEAIATLPRLSVSDIDDAPEEPAYEIDGKAPVTCLRHHVPTRGIAYASRFFDLGQVDFDDLPYVGLLALTLGKLDTAHHTAAELDTLVQDKLGNLSITTATFEDQNDAEAFRAEFAMGASALSENAEWLATLPREIALETDFTDTARILDMLKQHKIVMEQGFINAGHSCAMTRAQSYFLPSGVVRENLGAVEFYRFLCTLIQEYDERKASLPARLAAVAEKVFCDDNCTMSFAGADADYERFWLAKPECGRKRAGEGRLVVPAPVVKNEAFIVPSDVCYATLGWDRRLLGVERDGGWIVAARALSLDYLWNEVRVKGGAYGVGFQTLKAGALRFYSYRDPHLDGTIDRFEHAVDWLAAYDPSQEELEGFIVASVAGIDAPVKARALIRRQVDCYFCGRDPKERIEVRSQIIETKPEDVRAFADVVRQAVDKHALCAFGNREILESSNKDFELISLVG